jgi:hypothetical protein
MIKRSGDSAAAKLARRDRLQKASNFEISSRLFQRLVNGLFTAL